MAKIFGGSKSKSQQSSQQTSENRAYGAINAGYMPEATNSFQSGARALQAGLAGGFEGYRENTGVDFWKQLGLKKEAGKFSGRGLYNTGATLKALAGYEDGIETASYNDYLQQQAALAGLGVQGGNLVSGAGNYSQGTSQGTSVSKQYNGMGKFIGQIVGAAAASDERLKTDITKVGEHAGLGVYEFKYTDGTGPFVGVMAQEVEDKFPAALGPKTDDGYMTVNYHALQRITGAFENDFA